MKLLLFRSLWGLPGRWEDALFGLKAKGYHGVEAWLPPLRERPQLKKLLRKHRLAFIADIFTGGEGVQAHLRQFERELQAVETFGVLTKCVNSHSGSDAWGEEEAAEFFGAALRLEKKFGMTVLHETNRGRILFHPRPALRMLKRFPQLKLTCDFSHWVCVGESLLDDKSELIRLCAERCGHINARVGYEEGIQVSDPRAPEYRKHLESFERCWGKIWKAQKSRGMQESYLTPEYGPWPYGQALPYTQAPVADLSEICDWQARREAGIFAKKFGPKRP